MIQVQNLFALNECQPKGAEQISACIRRTKRRRMCGAQAVTSTQAKPKRKKSIKESMFG